MLHPTAPPPTALVCYLHPFAGPPHSAEQHQGLPLPAVVHCAAGKLILQAADLAAGGCWLLEHSQSLVPCPCRHLCPAAAAVAWHLRPHRC